MPKRLKHDISQQREEIRQYVRSFPPFEDMPAKTIDSTVDTLVNPPPSHDNVTSLTRIEPLRPGQSFTEDERAIVKAIFLEAFSEQANVTRACATAGISRETAYRWLREDEDFAAAWSVAEQHANDVLRGEAFRRAVTGVDEPIVSMGKLVRDESTGEMITVRKYSDNLLLTLMRARMPEYRDSRQVTVDSNVTVNTSHQLTIDTRGMNAEELSAIRQIAQAMKEREQARIEKTGKHDSAGE